MRCCIPASAASAAFAENSWLPSISTCGLAPPVTTATSALPSRSWSLAQDSPRPAAVSVTSNGDRSTLATALACGPDAATVMVLTSKLAA